MQTGTEILDFDTVRVATTPSTPYSGSPLALSTTDGLGLTLASDGGAVTGLSLGGASVHDASHAYAGGFFVRDVKAASDFVHVGGTANQAGNTVSHGGTISALNLGFASTYIASADRIVIDATVTDTSAAAERALTLYFALPVAASGWMWGDDIRRSRQVGGQAEFTNLRWEVGMGATGYISKYPWASLSGPPGGLALAVPLANPAAMRLIHNPVSNQFYAAFDIGLSPHTQPARQAAIQLVLYRFDAAAGFRAAAKGYYDRFPGSFTRRASPANEGIWIPFTDLDTIANSADFGIGVHELSGLNQVGVDETLGVLSLRYLTEPRSIRLDINDSQVDPNSYSDVMAYVQAQAASGNERAKAILSSGIYDASGNFVIENTSMEPWCHGARRCVLFTVNPDPDVSESVYAPNKAHLEWNTDTQAAYASTPNLGGEFVDGFALQGADIDFRVEHFAAADSPLTFRTSDRRVGIGELFATTEFSRWLAADIHGRGKMTMGNGVLHFWPWGADLFDIMGVEVNWMAGGSFQPYTDDQLSYYRTLSYQRPYNLLMNTDFDQFTSALVERYFQASLFYGLYPSMFSANSYSSRYWETSSLYDRDRPLFKRYIPLIRRLNTAGWQPVTFAASSNTNVYVERFGNGPNPHFTLRNMLETPVNVTLTLDATALGLPASDLKALALLRETNIPVNGAGAARTVTLILPAFATEVLYLSTATPQPTAISNPGAGSLTLTWPVVAGASQYRVLRHATNPYFVSYDPATVSIGPVTVTPTSATVTDTGAGVNDPSVNHTYRVLALDSGGNVIGMSSHLAEFTFALVAS